MWWVALKSTTMPDLGRYKQINNEYNIKLMDVMRNSIYFCLAIILLAFSCSKDSIVPAKDDIHNVDIGVYNLLQSSIDTIPYLGKKGITFIDSNFNEIVFEIFEKPIAQYDSAHLLKYNVYEPGDTVKYRYSFQSKNFKIRNDSLKIEFKFNLESRPYYLMPKNEYVADVIEIFLMDPGPEYIYSQVFYHETNTRTWQSSWNYQPISEKVILNKTFQNVLFVGFNNPLSVVNFNYQYGIISFTDFSGKLWRFDKFI